MQYMVQCLNNKKKFSACAHFIGINGQFTTSCDVQYAQSGPMIVDD